MWPIKLTSKNKLKKELLKGWIHYDEDKFDSMFWIFEQ